MTTIYVWIFLGGNNSETQIPEMFICLKKKEMLLVWNKLAAANSLQDTKNHERIQWLQSRQNSR